MVKHQLMASYVNKTENVFKKAFSKFGIFLQHTNLIVIHGHQNSILMSLAVAWLVPF